MRENIKRRRSSLLYGVATAALIMPMMGSVPAFGQDAAADDEEAVEEIVVTGSRIKRSSFADIDQPAVVVDSELFELAGFTNVADALNAVPSMGAGITDITLGSGQNVGQQFLDLFNLGTQRTLVVVNGRRFVPGNVLSGAPGGRIEGSQVDLNNFPTALVERIEILSIGGAPIYGADAIAGTINIILKDDYEGVDISFQYSNRLTPNVVDNYNINAVWGANFSDGRGNVTAAIQFEDQRGATANDFPGLRDGVDCFGDGGNPCIIGEDAEGVFSILEGPTGFLIAPGPGVPLPGLLGDGTPAQFLNVFVDANNNPLTFAGDGRLSIFEFGVKTGTSAVFFQGGNGFDLDDFQELQVPLNRFVFSSTAHYEINKNMRIFMETNFLSADSKDITSQVGTAFNTAFLNTQGIGSFGVSVNNPFIDPGDRQTILDSGAALNALSPGTFDGQTFFINGINLGLLPEAGANTTDTTTFRTVGGIEGDFQALGRNFNYEMSMNFGRTKQFRNQVEVRGGAFFNAVDSVALDAAMLAMLVDPDNLDLIAETTNSPTINVVRNGSVVALDPVDAMVGDILCAVFLNPPGALDRDPTNPRGNIGITVNTPTPDPDVAGCTPINLFIGAGNSIEAINFISTDGQSTGRVSQADWLGYVSGELLQLPAGWSQFSIGFERRREYGSFQSGGVLSDGLSREPAIPSIPQEEIVSNEFMAELRVPVFNEDFGFNIINDAIGFNLFNSLEINGAYRRIDQSGIKPLNVFTGGGSIDLFGGDLTIRGNFTRSARQPSLVELFSPDAQTFDQTGDPCDNRNITRAPSTNRAQNCLDAAIAAGFTNAQLLDVDGDGNFGLVLDIGDNEFQTPSVNAAIPLITGGNPNLIFEIGNSWTIGFIWQPKFVPNLTIGADLINIKISDVITEPDFSFFTQNCFDKSDFAAGNLESSCGNFERSGPGAATDGSVIGGFDIVSGKSGFANFSVLEFRAIQGQARYAFDVRDAANLFGMGGGSDLGSISIRALFLAPLTFRDAAAAIPLQLDGRVTNQVGSTGDPALKATFDISYAKGPFSMFWRTTYTHKGKPCFDNAEGDCDDIPQVALPLPFDMTHDASVGYQVTEYFGLRGGVNNIFGDPPTLAQEAFNFGGNNLGRLFFLRASASF